MHYNDPDATAERLRHGMYWTGDLAYRDAEGWIYLAGRTADWMRVDVAVYAVPDETVGDAVMAAVALRPGEMFTPKGFEEFLTAQRDLSPKAWPRYVRINDDLPHTATNKILKRELSAAGVTAGDGVLWARAPGDELHRARVAVKATR
jgi:fatty-acyl-CoA synthase